MSNQTIAEKRQLKRARAMLDHRFNHAPPSIRYPLPAHKKQDVTAGLVVSLVSAGLLVGVVVVLMIAMVMK